MLKSINSFFSKISRLRLSLHLSGVPCFTAFLPHVHSVVKMKFLLFLPLALQKKKTTLLSLVGWFFAFLSTKSFFQRFYLLLPESLLRSQLTGKKKRRKKGTLKVRKALPRGFILKCFKMVSPVDTYGFYSILIASCHCFL